MADSEATAKHPAGRDATREVLRMFSYGLFVATSLGPDGARGATVSWVTQVSFEPRLIAAAMRKGTAICGAVEASRRFSLHVVGANQTELAKAFFKANAASPDQIAGYHFALSENGVPVLDEALAWLECEVVEQASQNGDHAVFIARILGSGQRSSAAPALALRDTPWHYGG